MLTEDFDAAITSGMSQLTGGESSIGQSCESLGAESDTSSVSSGIDSPAPGSDGVRRARIAKVCDIEWIGQTLASVCWIGSVSACGISSTGDWLQLFAASAWLLANISSVAVIKAD